MLSISKNIAMAIAVSFTFLAGCKTKPAVTYNPKIIKTNLSKEHTLIFSTLLSSYLELKNALVATQNNVANENAERMKIQIVQLESSFQSDSISISKNRNIIVQLDSMKLQVDNILKNNARSCEPQRIYFKYLSDNIFNLTKIVDAGNLNLYHQYCPMAMNEKGAWWLSASTEIENPYFGSKMLTCGEVVDTLK
jgi:Cu(I)/Ag(I) efflux system membrane fusion protein